MPVFRFGLIRLSGPGRQACATAILGLGLVIATSAVAQTTPPAPSSPQPTLPAGTTAAAARSGASSPVVESIAATPPKPLEVRKRAVVQGSAPKPRRTRIGYRHHRVPYAIERPALAGVVLVEPVLAHRDSPRPMVLAPAYFIGGLAAAFTTPPPPVVCERRRRDRDLPDPHLYREIPVACAYDID